MSVNEERISDGKNILSETVRLLKENILEHSINNGGTLTPSNWE
jgi:hypothetical protein